LKQNRSKTKSKVTPPNQENLATTKKLVFKSFCAWDGEILVLNILGTPSAKQDAIGKPKGNQLKVSVTAAPVAGKATDHMVRFLAEQFGITPKEIEVVFGRMSIHKQLRICSPKLLPAVISKQLSKNEPLGNN